MPAAAIIVEEASSTMILTRNRRARQTRWQNVDWAVSSDLGDLRDLYNSGNYQIFHPDGRDYEIEVWPLIRFITFGEEDSDEEMVHLLTDGSRFKKRCDSSPIYNDQGNLVAGVGVFYDITN